MGLSQVRKFRYAAYAGSSLFANPGGTMYYPRVMSLEPTWDINMYPRVFQASDLKKHTSAIGERVAGLKFSTEGLGFSTVGAGSGVAAKDGETGVLFKHIWGNQTKDSGVTINSMTNADATSTAGSTLTLYGFIGIVGADGLYYARQIRNKTGSGPYVYTFCRILPTEAGTAATVGYASNFFTKADTGHTHTFLDYETAEIRRMFYGCMGNFALKNTSANGQLMFDWDFKALNWDETVALGISVPTVASGNYPSSSYGATMPTQGAIMRNTRLLIGSGGSPYTITASEFEFNLGNDVQAKVSSGATNGVSAWFIKDSARTFSFTMEVSDNSTFGETMVTRWAAGTNLDILVQMTQGGPGNSFALCMPVCQIQKVTPISVNGLDYVKVDTQICRDSTNGYPDVTWGML